MTREEYPDIHSTLQPYKEVLRFFQNLESKELVKQYCKGSNLGGRWIFQIYSEEFIQNLASLINTTLNSSKHDGPILEIMSGDGKLTEFLQPLVSRDFVTTDAKDGRYNIAYPKWVMKVDALKAVRRYNPSLVLICWEPYLSMIGIDVVGTGIPTAWIGHPEKCAHPDLFELKHIKMENRYALGKFDAFIANQFQTDVFLFNFDKLDIDTLDLLLTVNR